MGYCGPNGEDCIIDNLLGHPANGFYIDVGAHSPNHGTITKYFYEKGWNGINIEPQRNYFNQLNLARQRDINLNVAVGSENGTLKLWLGDGLSTFVEKYAHTDWEQIEVPVVTLKEICDTHVGDRTIDFLKIDVEGWEREVILGADWERYRPRVLCIEATIPMTTIDIYSEWEDILLNAKYEFVQKDSYNRYYTPSKE